MNQRERYIATLTFGQPDKVCFNPGHGRESTRAAWYKQGLPQSVTDYHAYLCDLIGIPQQTLPRVTHNQIGVDFRMMPHFEEKVIEDRGDTHIVQDWKGNICEISKEFDTSYLRNAIDFVTRSWISYPVQTHDDWEQMKQRYEVEAAGRIPADIKQRGKALKNRTHPAGLSLSGPFWQLREWLGFENLCMLLMDDPGFADEMINFWEEFISQLLQRIFEYHVPDFVMINEDMAYKEKPMVGPDQSRRFLLPCWEKWGELCKQAGVPIYEVDSDGYVGDLIPVWIEAGFNCNTPQEVAAGNDLPAFRKKYNQQMAYSGGVDKRAMAKGGQVIRNEMARLQPVIKAGGYLPSCDHGVPSDVAWDDFVDYARLLAEATGWL